MHRLVTSRTFGPGAAAILIAALFTLPLLLGLAGTLIPALGYMPSLAPGNGFNEILNDPRLQPAVLLSLKTGLLATVLTLSLTVLTLVCVHNTRWGDGC